MLLHGMHPSLEVHGLSLCSKSEHIPILTSFIDSLFSWDFLSWLTSTDKMQFYEKAAAFCVFGRGCTMLLTWMTATPAWRMWSNRKKKKKSKEQNMWDKLTRSTAREFMTKVGAVAWSNL